MAGFVGEGTDWTECTIAEAFVLAVTGALLSRERNTPCVGGNVALVSVARLLVHCGTIYQIA